MNVRGMILAATLICTAAGCATTQGATTSSITPAVQGAREEEYHFNGYSLKVKVDDGGMPVSAKAFDKDSKEIPATIVPAREVTACLPKAGGGQHCEPFLYMPEKTFFKIGTGTICSMWYQNHWIYYQC